MHSIRFKITAVTIVSILTSILALGGLGIWSIGRDSDRTSVEKMSLICENIQEKLNAYLGSLQQSVEMGIHMADDFLEDIDPTLFLSTRSPEQTEQLTAILSAHCAEVEHAFSSIAHNTNGIVTYYYCVNDELGSSEHGFFWSKQNSDDFVKQPPLISSDMDIDDLEHSTWYYSPVKAGTPVWVGPYVAHFLGDALTISYVAPIYNRGFLIGVLGMDILLETIIDQIRTVQIYDTGYAFLLDKDGKVLYHPYLDRGTDTEDFGVDRSSDVFKQSSSGDALIRFLINGQVRQIAFSTLRNSLKVAVIAPVSEINASQRQMLIQIIAVSAVILAIYFVVTLLVMNALTKPLLNLVSASKRLMDGDYDAQLDYEGKDEVGVLTLTFRHMRDYLKLYISDLNSRVYYDAMTGVKNKGAFLIAMGQLNKEIRMGGQDGALKFAIVSMDCNGLKQINDGYGHERGDIYLQTACQLICRVFSHSPVFRLGGDEFGVILQKEDYENRDALMASFAREAEETCVTAKHPWEIVNIARGMADFIPGKDQNAEQVLSRADQTMYKDKNHSR